MLWLPKRLRKKECPVHGWRRHRGGFLFPSCTCCGTCDICSDAFTRGDGTDISTGSDCGWTEVSGAWDITSNQLRCTTAGVASCNTVHPDADSTMVVEVDFKHNTLGSACDVIVGYVDANNYFYARYLINDASSTIAIRKAVAGVHSQIAVATTSVSGVTMGVDTFYTAKVCVNESLGITASLAGNAKISCGPQSITGDQCGLGCNGSGTATFDNFSFSYAYSATQTDCEQCTAACPACDDNQAPTQVQVVLSGMVSLIDCANCEDYDGTYILDYHGRVTTDPCSGASISSSCVWCYSFPDTSICGGVNFLSVRFNISTGSLDVFLTNAVFALTWTDNPGDSLCTDWSNYDVPPTVTANTYCDPSGSTLLLTAL